MRKPEQKVYDMLQLQFAKVPELWYDRIESRVSSRGMPDVITMCRSTCFIETKAGKVVGDSITVENWTANQRRWARRSWGAGTPYYVVVGDPDTGTLVAFSGSLLEAQAQPTSKTLVRLCLTTHVDLTFVRGIAHQP